MRPSLALSLLLASCSDSEPEAPAPIHQAPVEQAAPQAPPSPPRPARPTMAREIWFIQHISADGKKVLLRETTRDEEGHGPLRYRVILTDTNTIESDVSLPTLAAVSRESLPDGGGDRPGATLPLSDPAIASELLTVAPILAPFSLGDGGPIAASPDGRHVAFNAVDWIFTADRGVVGTRLAKQASYGPWFTPDGKTLLYRRMNGTFDGIEGKYELYATSVDGTAKPERIAGTAGAWEPFVATKDAVRIIATAGPRAKTCVIEVPLVAPFKVKKLACVAGGATRTSSCVLSPSAIWAACGTVTDGAEPEYGTIAFEVATGKIGYRKVRSESASAISDDGTLVMHGAQRLLVIDPKGASRELHPQSYVSMFTYFKDPTHIITEQNGDIVVLDITR